MVAWSVRGPAHLGRYQALGAMVAAALLGGWTTSLRADAADAAAPTIQPVAGHVSQRTPGRTTAAAVTENVQAGSASAPKDEHVACRAVAEGDERWQHARELRALLTTKPAAELQATARSQGLSDVWLKRARAKDAPSTRRLLARLASKADTQLSVACDADTRDAQPPDACVCIISPRAGSLRVKDLGVRVTLVDGFSEPELWLVDQTGMPEQVSMAEVERLTQSPDVCKVQLTAKGPQGRRPVAELDLKPGGCAKASPASETTAFILATPEATLSPESIVALLNTERRDVQAGPLRLHRRLSAAARLRAQAVALEPYPTHRSLAEPQDVGKAIAQQGLRTGGHAETVACGASRQGALHALLQSPAHLSQLLAQPFSDLGIAEAPSTARGRVCLVLILARYPRLR